MRITKLIQPGQKILVYREDTIPALMPLLLCGARILYLQAYALRHSKAKQRDLHERTLSAPGRNASLFY